MILLEADYFCYMYTSALGVLFAHLLFPKTENRRLEEIDEFFMNSDSALHAVRVAQELPWDARMFSVVEDKVDKTGRLEKARRWSVDSTD
jgi:hypothetical protein